MIGQAKKAALSVVVIAVLWSAAWGGETAFPQEWSSMDSKGLVAVATDLYKAGESAAADRKLLAQYVAQRFLTDVAAIKTADCHDWADFAWYFHFDLTYQERQTWAMRVHAAYAPDQQTLDEMEPISVAFLARALGQLYDREFIPMIVDWMQNHQEWRSWDPGFVWPKLKYLVWLSPAESPLRAILVAYLNDGYLASVEATRAVDVGIWEDTARTLLIGQPATVRQFWLARLMEAFVSENHLLGMKADELIEFVKALKTLQGTDLPKIASQWITQSPNWPSTEPKYWKNLIKLVQADRSDPVIAQAQDMIAAKVIAKLDADGEKNKVDWKDCDAISRLARQKGDSAKAQEWAMKAYEATVGTEEARRTVDVATLLGTSMLLRDSGLLKEGAAYAGYAQAITELAKKDLPEIDPFFMREDNYVITNNARYLSLPLANPETRAIVQAELTDPNGMPRPGVYKILAWAYRDAGQLRNWKKTLDDAIIASGESGDLKAAWLMARAYAESVPTNGNMPAPMCGIHQLMEAYNTADSLSLKCEVLNAIGIAYLAAGKGADGVKLLMERRTDFAGTAALDQYEEVLGRVMETNGFVVRMIEHASVNQAIRNQAYHTEELSRRLEKARADGDSEGVARYQGLLSQKGQQ